MMNYIELYRKIVNRQNENSLLQLLKDTGDWEKLQGTHFEIVEDEMLPYILVTVDYETGRIGYFASIMIGIPLEKENIFPFIGDYSLDYFYLPVIAKPQKTFEQLKQYYSVEQAIHHELLHIADILQWIDDDPSYIEKVIHYTFEAATEDTLESSIDFEVGKIFKLEPPAMGSDFDTGETMIIEPFLGLFLMKYECKSKNEYVAIKISDYLRALKQMYEGNFSEKKEAIEQYFKKSIDHHGKTIFGESPYLAFLQTGKDKIEKMLKHSHLPKQGKKKRAVTIKPAI